MKFYMVSTYELGNIICYSKNKNELRSFLDEREITYYDIQPLKQFCNDTYSDETAIILE